MSYKYEPLVGDDIRVLRFCASETAAASSINCELQLIPINGATHYYALSYTWGPISVTEPIVLDGIQFQVTKNLAAVLRVLTKLLKPFGPDTLVWVDAICINQADVSERNKQVLRMTEIYQRACEVFLWLGPALDDGDFILEKLEGLAQIVRTAATDPTRIRMVDALQISIGQVLQLLHADMAEAQRFWDGLQDLFNRSWWSRTWILQETASSSRKIFFCGDRAFDDVGLHAALILARNVASEYLTVQNFHSDYAAGVFIFEKNCRDDSRLLNLLGLCRSAVSTDPRDKVYGVLGLATDLEDGELSPNYALPYSQIYTDVAVWSMMKTNSLDVLGHCVFTVSQDKGLPSWVPDWTIQAGSIPFPKDIKSPDQTGIKVYHASNDSHLLQDNEDSRLISGNCLKLKGLSIGQIERLEASANVPGGDIQKSWEPTNGHKIYSWTGESLTKAYLRTIVADFGPSQTGEWGIATRGYAMSWKPHSALPAAILLMKQATAYRRFAYTASGLMGLVPEETELGDSVFALRGGQVLYVLRYVQNNQYRLIGEAYFHGMMDGEALKLLGPAKVGFEEIALI